MASIDTAKPRPAHPHSVPPVQPPVGGTSADDGGTSGVGRYRRRPFRHRLWGHHPTKRDSTREQGQVLADDPHVIEPVPVEVPRYTSHATLPVVKPLPSASLDIHMQSSVRSASQIPEGSIPLLSPLGPQPSIGNDISETMLEDAIAETQRKAEYEDELAAQIESSILFLSVYEKDKARREEHSKRPISLPLPKVLTRNELSSRLPKSLAKAKRDADLAVYHSHMGHFRRHGLGPSVESLDLLQKEPEDIPVPELTFWENKKGMVIPPDRNRAAEEIRPSDEAGGRTHKPSRWYLDDVGSAMDVMMDLRTDQMHSLKLEFDRAREEGVNLTEFVAHLKRKLPAEVTESEDSIAGLIELFHEIDLNGDGYVGWEEFTTFVTESASVTSDRFVIEDLRKYEPSSVIDETVHDLGIERVDYIAELDRLVTCERNHTIQIYAAADCRLLKQIPIGKGSAVSVSYVPSVNCIIVATSDLHLTFFDAVTYRRRGRFAIQETITTVTFDTLYSSLFTGSSSGSIKVWRLATPSGAHRGGLELTETMSLSPSHTGAIMDLKVVRDLGALISCSLDSTVRLWDLRTGTLKRVLRGHTKGVLSIAYAADYKVLISAGFDHSAIVWNPFVEGLKFPLKGHQNPLVGCFWVPFTPQVITLDASGLVNVWDVRSMACVHSSDARVSDLNSFAYCDTNERLVLVGTSSRALTFMDYARPHHPDKADEHPVLCALFNPSNFTILTVAERTVKIWDCKTGKLSQAYRNVTPAQITAACLDDRNRKFFVGDAEGHIICCNYANGAFIKKLVPHTGEVSSLVYCTPERCVLSTSWDKTLMVHDESDITKGHLLLKLEGHNGDVTCASFSSRLLLIASGDVNGAINVWDFQDGTLDGVCKSESAEEVTCVRFFERKPLLLSADSSGSIVMWALPPLNNRYIPLLTLKNHEYLYTGPAPLISLCYSEKTETVFAGDEKGYIHRWDLSEALGMVNVDAFTDIERSVARPYNATYKGKPAKRGTKTHNPLLRASFTANPVPADLDIPKREWNANCDSISHLELCDDTVTEICVISASQDRQVSVWSTDGKCMGKLQQMSRRELAHRGIISAMGSNNKADPRGPGHDWAFPVDIEGRRARDRTLVRHIMSQVRTQHKALPVKDRLRLLRTSVKEDSGHHSENLYGGAAKDANTFLTELHEDFERHVDVEGNLHYDGEMGEELDRSQVVEPFLSGKLPLPPDPQQVVKMKADPSSMETRYQISQLAPFFSSTGRRAEDSVRVVHLPPHALASHKQKKLSKLPEIPRLYSARERVSFWSRLQSEAAQTPRRLGSNTSRF